MSLFEKFRSRIDLFVSEEDGERDIYDSKHLATPMRKQTIKLAARPLKALTAKMCRKDPEINMHIEIIMEADLWTCKATQLKPILDSFKALATHIDNYKKARAASAYARECAAHRGTSRKW